MERQFPKNVRQIGNVGDEPKIYVEDYVDIYLNQQEQQTEETPVGIILIGEILKLEGQDVVCHFLSHIHVQSAAPKYWNRDGWHGRCPWQGPLLRYHKSKKYDL